MSSWSVSRKEKRVKYSLPVSCLGCYEILEGKTVNLSADGVCLMLSKQVPEGSVLSLIFKLPTMEKPLVVCSRVLWAKQQANGAAVQAGLQHLWLSSRDRDQFSVFLSVFKDENPETATRH